MELRLAISTFPDIEKASEVARRLVEEKLCACVNIIPKIASIYSWQGKLCTDEEVLLIIKTCASSVDALERRLIELHSYDTPEFLVLTPDKVNAKYLEWALRVMTP